MMHTVLVCGPTSNGDYVSLFGSPILFFQIQTYGFVERLMSFDLKKWVWTMLPLAKSVHAYRLEDNLAAYDMLMLTAL